MIKKKANVSETEAFERACEQNGIKLTTKEKQKGYIDYINLKEEVIRMYKSRKSRKLIVKTMIHKLRIKFKT